MSAVMESLREMRTHLPSWAYVEREREIGRGFHIGPIVVVSKKSGEERANEHFQNGVELGVAWSRPVEPRPPNVRHLRSI